MDAGLSPIAAGARHKKMPGIHVTLNGIDLAAPAVVGTKREWRFQSACLHACPLLSLLVKYDSGMREEIDGDDRRDSVASLQLKNCHSFVKGRPAKEFAPTTIKPVATWKYNSFTLNVVVLNISVRRTPEFLQLSHRVCSILF